MILPRKIDLLGFSKLIAAVVYIDIQIRTFDYTHLGFQFSDFQLESFVDPKPVEL